MEKVNGLLKSARIEKCWSLQFVSEQVGVSCVTYRRWEAGVQVPRQASLDALCGVFELSPAELGFVVQTEEVNAERIRTAFSQLASDQAEKSTVAAGWSGGVRIDAEVAREEAELVLEDTDDIELAASLATWSLGILSCWQWYMAGGQRELEQLVPTYITRLTRPTLTPGPEQKTAASLMSQVYQLIALLDLQRGDFVTAQANGTQALVYSQLGNDWNVYVAAQIRMAVIFSARKRIGLALSAYNDALHRINTNNDRISPILHSWIFAGLAEIQATMGRETEALQFLQLAIAVFPEKPETDACIAYTQCDRSMLYLYQGLVFLRLGQPRLAWDAFSLVDEMKPGPPERIRADFLRYRAYTSLVLGNMIQSCIYLEASVHAAHTINSALAFSEVYSLYEHILAVWGQEPRVKALAMLFQS